MFMIQKIGGVVCTRSVKWKPKMEQGKTVPRGKGPLRTRDGWARIMGPCAAAWNCRYYAFRHGGSWWRYDVVACDAPVEMDSREAVEMWLMYRA